MTQTTAAHLHTTDATAARNGGTTAHSRSRWRCVFTCPKQRRHVSSGGGYSPAEVAGAAGHAELAELLERKGGASSASDHKKLRLWLEELDCGAYYSRFVDAGYDFGFIALHGLGADDVDAVGVPASKLGLRKKLMAKYKFPQEVSRHGGILAVRWGSGV